MLARRGRRVVLVERSPAYRWRACGVFASPAAVAALRSSGLADETIARVARSIPAMRVETAAGSTFRLAYGDDGRLVAPAVGFDRSALDPALVELAAGFGADVRLGEAVTAVERGRVTVAGREVLPARIVVGADGLRSIVARSFGAATSGQAGVTRRADVPRRRPGAGHASRRPDDPVRRRLCRAGAGARATRECRDRAGRHVAGRAAARRGGGDRRQPFSRRFRGPTTTRSTGPARSAATRSRGLRRSASGRRDEPATAGCWRATLPGSSTRSPARGCIGRSCPPGSRRRPSTARSMATGQRSRPTTDR